MSDNVVIFDGHIFDGHTTQDIPVERVLGGAKDLDQALVIGWDENGDFYMVASTAQLKDLAWLLLNADEMLREWINAQDEE